MMAPRPTVMAAAPLSLHPAAEQEHFPSVFGPTLLSVETLSQVWYLSVPVVLQWQPFVVTDVSLPHL